MEKLKNLFVPALLVCCVGVCASLLATHIVYASTWWVRMQKLINHFAPTVWVCCFLGMCLVVNIHSLCIGMAGENSTLNNHFEL